MKNAYFMHININYWSILIILIYYPLLLLTYLDLHAIEISGIGISVGYNISVYYI